MAIEPVRDARLDLRLPLSTKHLIEEAAQLEGQTLSAFVLSQAIEKAQQTLREHQLIKLQAEEAQRFFQALDNPPAPADKLKQLFKRHHS